MAIFSFAKKDRHKKVSSKVLIMTHAFSNVVMDKIEEAVKNGVAGNENDTMLTASPEGFFRQSLLHRLKTPQGVT